MNPLAALQYTRATAHYQLATLSRAPGAENASSLERVAVCRVPCAVCRSPLAARSQQLVDEIASLYPRLVTLNLSNNGAPLSRIARPCPRSTLRGMTRAT